MNESIRNLFGLYSEIGETDAATVECNRQFSVVKAKNGYWPQLIFNIDFENAGADEPQQHFARIMNQANVDFAVCETEGFESSNQTFFRQSGIFPVKTWTLMEVSKVEASEVVPEEQLRELQLNNELDEFCGIANSMMMGNLKLGLDLVKDLAARPKFKFYGLFVRKELASVMLAFTENKITGLYFIATKSEYQGRGYAEKLIRHAAVIMLNQKTEKVVLQAVQKAVPLYSRIGFNSCGKLTVFWKR